MKKKLFAALVAVMMLAALVPTAVFAADETGKDDSGTIGGNSTVDTVTKNVVVPLNLNFALNPLEIGEPEGGQINDTSYTIVNKTLAPVKVGFDLTIEAAADVTVVGDPKTLKPDDISATDKNIYMALMGASGITYTGTDFTKVVEETTLAFDSAKTSTLAPFSASSGIGEDDAEGSIAFVLTAAEKAAAEDLVAGKLPATATEAIAGFQLYGKLNTYAAWKASDVKLTGTYTLVALRSGTFTDLRADNDAWAEDGVNQLASTATSTEVGFKDRTGSNTATAATFNIPKAGTAAAFPIQFEFGALTLSEMQFASGTVMAATDNYSVDTTAGTITLDAKRVTTLKSGAVGTSTVFKVKLSDNSLYTLTIKIA